MGNVKKFASFISEELKIDDKIHTGNNRFRVTLSFDIWSDSEENAKKNAEKIATEIGEHYDNSPKLISVGKNSFGKL